MSRLFVLLALVVVPATSFGQDWFQADRSSCTSGVGDLRSRSAGVSISPEASQPTIALWSVGSRDVWASQDLLGSSALFNEHADAELGNPPAMASWLPSLEVSHGVRPAFDFASSGELVIRGQSPSGGGSGGSGGGGGAGAAEATDPSVPLTQLQFQNIFTPESYDASGYSNTFIVQPVIPLNIGEDAFFPYHIIRPTIPVIAPTADPDGPRGVHGGLGDTTIVDVFIHPSEALKTNFGIGYVGILPTRTHPALGRGEWQLGPSAVVISRAIPKWIVGGLVEVPFSLESDAYTVQMQGIALRLLPNEWFIGWGDQILKFDDQNGGYDIPLSLQFGKVVKVGETPMKLFIEPIYTPPGLRSGPGGPEWGIKLNLTILFPEAKFQAPLLSGLGGGHCCR